MLIEMLIIQQASRTTPSRRPVPMEEEPQNDAWVGFWVVLSSMISLAAVVAIVVVMAA